MCCWIYAALLGYPKRNGGPVAAFVAEVSVWKEVSVPCYQEAVVVGPVIEAVLFEICHWPYWRV